MYNIPVVEFCQPRVYSVRQASHLTPSEIAEKYNMTYSQLPQPQGSWQDDYNARNTKYNIMLAANLLFAGFSVYMVIC
jgi:hypothetical protein